MIETNKKQFKILLIEDSEADVELIKYVMKSEAISANLAVSENGEQALDYLYQRDNFNNTPTPDLILLDLNIPGITGFEVLKEIKTSDTLRQIPVIVLTSSGSDIDIINCYDLHANSYIQKPMNFDLLAKSFRALEEFWFKTATLPTTVK